MAYEHRRQNVHKRKPGGSLGAVEANRPECSTIRSLDKGVQESAGSKASMGLRITLIALRHRLLDAHDAVEYSFKPLTDAIATTVGLDDADARLHWEYAQIKTTGTEGTLVVITAT